MKNISMPFAHIFDQTDDEIIKATARYIRVTAEQYTRHPVLPNTLRIIRQRLRYLVDNEFLIVSRGFSHNSTPPRVYSPTLKGWRYAQEQHGLPIPRRWRPNEAQLSDFHEYLHDLTITDSALALEALCSDAPSTCRLKEFVHDRFLPQPKLKLANGTEQAVRLDAFLQLALRRDGFAKPIKRTALLEVDRRSHYRVALTNKFLAQIAYVQGGHFEQQFHTPSVLYWWVCPQGEQRVNELKTLLESLMREYHLSDYAPMFLLTSCDPARTDPFRLFLEPTSSVPFREEPVSLLPYAPLAAVQPEQSRYLPQEQYASFMATPSDALPFLSAEASHN